MLLVNGFFKNLIKKLISKDFLMDKKVIVSYIVVFTFLYFIESIITFSFLSFFNPLLVGLLLVTIWLHSYEGISHIINDYVYWFELKILFNFFVLLIFGRLLFLSFLGLLF